MNPRRKEFIVSAGQTIRSRTAPAQAPTSARNSSFVSSGAAGGAVKCSSAAAVAAVAASCGRAMLDAAVTSP